jgi:hypothetical protein
LSHTPVQLHYLLRFLEHLDRDWQKKKRIMLRSYLYFDVGLLLKNENLEINIDNQIAIIEKVFLIFIGQ